MSMLEAMLPLPLEHASQSALPLPVPALEPGPSTSAGELSVAAASRSTGDIVILAPPDQSDARALNISYYQVTSMTVSQLKHTIARINKHRGFTTKSDDYVMLSVRKEGGGYKPATRDQLKVIVLMELALSTAFPGTSTETTTKASNPITLTIRLTQWKTFYEHSLWVLRGRTTEEREARRFDFERQRREQQAAAAQATSVLVDAGNDENSEGVSPSPASSSVDPYESARLLIRLGAIPSVSTPIEVGKAYRELMSTAGCSASLPSFSNDPCEPEFSTPAAWPSSLPEHSLSAVLDMPTLASSPANVFISAVGSSSLNGTVSGSPSASQPIGPSHTRTSALPAPPSPPSSPPHGTTGDLQADDHSRGLLDPDLPSFDKITGVEDAIRQWTDGTCERLATKYRNNKKYPRVWDKLKTQYHRRKVCYEEMVAFPSMVSFLDHWRHVNATDSTVAYRTVWNGIKDRTKKIKAAQAEVGKDGWHAKYGKMPEYKAWDAYNKVLSDGHLARLKEEMGALVAAQTCT